MTVNVEVTIASLPLALSCVAIAVVSTLLLLGFHVFQQSIQSLEVALPDLSIAFDPGVSLRQRLRLDPARAFKDVGFDSLAAWPTSVRW